MSTTRRVDLLEREDELVALTEAIDAARQGAGRLIAIEGTAGIGKTRLLASAREAAAEAGMRVLAARGGELERSFAYGIVRQLFEPALARSAAEEKEEARAGAAALAAPLFEAEPGESANRGSAQGPMALLHGLFWLAVNLAERRPLLFAVDDLHWSDAPSLEWLCYLLRRLEGLPILVAVALRPAEPGSDVLMLAQLTTDPLATVIHPSPLSAQATRVLIEQRLEGDPAEEFCAACHEASGGNPLLLRELLDALAAEHVAPVGSQVSRVHKIGPGAVSRAVRLRLAALPPEAQRFARAVAVLGDDADLEVAGALAEIDREAALEAAATLAQVDVLRSERELAFVHPLVRAAVYAELPPRERGRAHARAAEILTEYDAPKEEVAAQILHAPRTGSELAVTTLREAARQALVRSAATNAAVYLGRALDEPPPADQRGELLFELGSAEALIRAPKADVHLREAFAFTEDPRRRAEIELTVARLLFLRGETAEALEVLERARAALPAKEADLRDRFEAELIGMALSDASTHAIGASRLVRTREPAGESVGARMLLAFAAYGDSFRGRSRNRCIDRAERALADGALIAEETSWSRYAAVLALYYAGRIQRAQEAFSEMVSAARAAGASESFAIASAGRARMLLDHGLVLEAEAEARTGYAACPEGQLIARGNVADVLANVLTKRADLPGAAAALAQAGIGEDEHPHSLLLVRFLDVRGCLRRTEGNAAAALDDFVAISEIIEPIGCRNPAIAHWRSEAALALLQLGQVAEARRLTREELPLAQGWGAPSVVGRTLIALGLVEGGRKGLEHLREAVTVLEKSEGGYELLRARIELGAALRRANQRAEAREVLRRCLEQAQGCGATLLADQAHAELLATGARPRRLVLSGVDSLTPSERRIAAMAAEGMSNREIAQALFVTPKTVEMHMGHVFRKLEIHSRTELPGVLTATSHERHSLADAHKG